MNVKSWQAQPIAWRIGSLVVIAAVAIASASRGEIPQDARKPFAGERETAMHNGAKFKGDRVETQDGYRMLAK